MIGLPTDPAVVEAVELAARFGLVPVELRDAVVELGEQFRTHLIPAFAAFGEQVALVAAAFATLRPVIAKWNRQEVHARRRAGRPRSRRRPGRTRRRR